jgi:hypothetical protein
MRTALWSIVLVGCGPVSLGSEPRVDAASDAPSGITVSFAVRPVECPCFELSALPEGGEPPYTVSWSTGESGPTVRVCVADVARAISASVVDAAQNSAASSGVLLDPPESGPCPPQPARMCLENPSLEGTPAANVGLTPQFDLPSWSDCTNPAAANTPDVSNNTIKQDFTVLPDPSDGTTFVALGEGEQITQTLCAPLTARSRVFLKLDLARIDLALTPTTERVFLEIWGGIAADCSRRQLLWASPALSTGFSTFCATLDTTAYLDAITLRGGADQSQLSPGYLLVDHLVPVDSCP